MWEILVYKRGDNLDYIKTEKKSTFSDAMDYLQQLKSDEFAMIGVWKRDEYDIRLKLTKDGLIKDINNFKTYWKAILPDDKCIDMNEEIDVVSYFMEYMSFVINNGLK